MTAENQGYLPPALVQAIDTAQSVAKGGIIASRQLTRGERERLQNAGYLRALMRGWYHFITPWSTTPEVDEPAVFRQFLSVYLEDRLGDRWCFSATTSLQLLMDHKSMPDKVVVMAESGSTTTREYIEGPHLTIYPDPQRFPPRVEYQAGLRFMPPQMALIRLPASVWQEQPDMVTAAVGLIYDWDQLAWTLMREGRTQAAQRLVNWLVAADRHPLAEMIHARMVEGGFRCTLATEEMPETSGPEPESDPEPVDKDPVQAILEAAGEPVAELDPEPVVKELPVVEVESVVEGELPTAPELPSDAGSASARSLIDLWAAWRPGVLEIAGNRASTIPPFLPHLAAIQTAQIDDTVASLALSHYTITRDHVLNTLAEPERAASAAGWPILEEDEKLLKPDHNEPLPGDHDPMAVVAMQGYVDAFRLVKRSIIRLLENEPVEKVLRQEMRAWYATMMRPSAEAGLLYIRQLNRYRSSETPSMSVHRAAPPAEDIILCMETLVQLVSTEPAPACRGLLALLGMSWISPWALGNGRMARFLMNTLRSAGGHPWLIPAQPDPTAYQQALTAAFKEQDGRPMARLFSATAAGQA